MTELSDELVDNIEMFLSGKGINLNTKELEQVRDLLDGILEKYLKKKFVQYQKILKCII